MNLLPLTFQGWLECCIIVCSLYWALTKSAQRYGNRILLAAFGYVLFYFGIYATSCTLLIPLMPYITIVICVSALVYKNNTISAPIQPAKRDIIADEAHNWLATIIKTIFNHPNATAPITILIEYSKPLDSAVQSTTTSMNIPWHQELFTSLLYDPTLSNTMIWLNSHGLLHGLHAQWIRTEKTEPKNVHTLHAQHTQLHDALVCIIDPILRSCIIIHNGIICAPKTLIETVHYISLVTHQINSYTEEHYHGARKKGQDSVNRST